MAEVPCRKEELVKYGKNFDEDRVKVSMRKWLETVKVPADKQAEIMDAMINRYGHQAAYTLMLRAMVEPFYVMQELGESLDGKLTSIGVIRRMATGTELTSEQVELLSRRTKEPKQNSDDNSKGTNNGSQGQGRQGNSNQSGLSKRGDGGQPQQLTEPTKPVLDEDIAGLPKKRIKEILDESNYDPNNPKYNTWYYFDAEMKRPAALVYVNGEIAYYKKDGKPGVIDRYVHADGSITYYEDGHKAYTQLKDGAVIDEKAQRSQKPSGQGGDEIDNRIDQRKQEKQKKQKKPEKDKKPEKEKKSKGDKNKTSRTMIGDYGNTIHLRKNGTTPKWMEIAKPGEYNTKDGIAIKEIHYKKDGVTPKWGRGTDGKKYYYNEKNKQYEKRNFFQWVTGLFTKIDKGIKDVSGTIKKGEKAVTGAGNLGDIGSILFEKREQLIGKYSEDFVKKLEKLKEDPSKYKELLGRLDATNDAELVEAMLKKEKSDVEAVLADFGISVKKDGQNQNQKGGDKAKSESGNVQNGGVSQAKATNGSTGQQQNDGIEISEVKIVDDQRVVCGTQDNVKFEVHYNDATGTTVDYVVINDEKNGTSYLITIRENGSGENEFVVEQTYKVEGKADLKTDQIIYNDNGTVKEILINNGTFEVLSDGCIGRIYSGNDRDDCLTGERLGNYKKEVTKAEMRAMEVIDNCDKKHEEATGLRISEEFKDRLEKMNERLIKRYDNIVNNDKVKAAQQSQAMTIAASETNSR